jgi:branched-chain amino acid transport system ATP-binding protein
MATQGVASESVEPILRLRQVMCRFGGLLAVRDLDLEVAHGERRAILGPNGAGKTTTFNLIAGDLFPTSGTVEFKGRDVTNMLARKRNKLGMGRTYQKSRLFGGLSVEDNLYLSILGHGSGHLRPVVRPGKDEPMRQRARVLAHEGGLGEKLDGLVGFLSHGEQRQLEVAMARASDPELLLLDEPASGLSPGERVSLTKMLTQLDPSITLILIEHDMDVALRVADRVTMMHDGQRIIEGYPDEIRASQVVHDIYLGNTVT